MLHSSISLRRRIIEFHIPVVGSSWMSPARSPCPSYPRAPHPPTSMWPGQWQNNNGTAELSAAPPTSEPGVDMLSMLGEWQPRVIQC